MFNMSAAKKIQFNQSSPTYKNSKKSITVSCIKLDCITIVNMFQIVRCSKLPAFIYLSTTA